MEQYLNVSEKFYSLQGEGPTVGQPAIFLRLAGCNLMCGGKGTEKDGKLHDGATWRCDSIEVWMESVKVKFEDVFTREDIDLFKKGAHLIITGGEPLLHQKKLALFLSWLSRNECSPYVEIETNGTIEPNICMLTQVDQWNISPKLSNSGMPSLKRINADALRMLHEAANICFKFVIEQRSDIGELLADFGSLIDLRKVTLMPAGSTREEINRTAPMVADLCKEMGWRMTPRMHIDIWNQKTGV